MPYDFTNVIQEASFGNPKHNSITVDERSVATMSRKEQMLVPLFLFNNN